MPYTGSAGSIAGFVLCFLVIISMYGGGFATVPAYLKDMFGTRYVGAIHGWLITAWSVAGIFGPVLVNYIREYNINHGVPKAQAYNVTMYIMAALLVIGFIANLLIKAVNSRFYMKPEDNALATAAQAGRDVADSLTRKPASAKENLMTTRTSRHTGVAPRARLGICRHTPHLGGVANDHQRAKAFPIRQVILSRRCGGFGRRIHFVGCDATRTKVP